MLTIPDVLKLPLWVVLVALPAAYGWWSGRRVLPLRDNPVFEQRLLARRQRGVQLLAVCAAAMIILGSPWLIVPLIFATAVGDFPLRRALFHETWSLGGYLLFRARAILAGFLPWIFVAAMPALLLNVFPIVGNATLAAGRVGLALGAVVVALMLERAAQRIWITISGARPLENAALRARFDEIVRRANTRPPQILEWSPAGGRMPNAFALPGINETAVAIGGDLIAQLSEDEITGIFAHELAHLEYYSPRRLRQRRWETDAFVVTGALLALYLGGAGASLRWVVTAWPLLTILMMARRLAHRQQHETDSDLRALELTGNADALIGGLTAVHTLARLPRRWAPEFEDRATHPSLARRIQKIREAAGEAHPHAQLTDETLVVRSSDPSRVVALEAARAWWFDGLPVDSPLLVADMQRSAHGVRSLAYERLSQLRVSVSAREHALVATEKGGATWSVPLRVEDVPAVERALDRVDSRLAVRDKTVSAQSVLLYALVALIASMISGAYGIALVVILLLFIFPSRAAIAATGAMLVARAVLLLAGWPLSLRIAPELLGVSLMLAAGAYAGWLLWRRRAQVAEKQMSGTLALVAVTIMTLVAALQAELALHSGGMLALAVSNALLPLAIALVGLTAALAVRPERKWRAFAWVMGAFTLVIASTAPLADRMAGIPRLAWESRMINDEATVEVPEGSWGLRASPSGERFAVTVQRGDDEDRASRFAVGTIDSGVARTVTAREVAFAGEDRVILLEAVANGAFAVQCEAAVTGGSCGSDTVRDVIDPELHASEGGRWWIIANADEDGDSVAVVTHTPGAPLVRRVFASSGGHASPLVFDDGATLIAGRAHPALPFGRSYGVAAALLGGRAWAYEFWRSDSHGSTEVSRIPGWPVCENDGAIRALCLVRGDSRIVLFSLTSRGIVSPAAAFPTSRGAVAIGSDQRVAMAAWDDDGFMVLAPATRSAVRFVGSQVRPVPVAIVPIANGVMILALDKASHMAVTRYRSLPTR